MITMSNQNNFTQTEINKNIRKNSFKFKGSKLTTSVNGNNKINYIINNCSALGIIQYNDFIVYGEINKIYYLIITSNSLIFQESLNSKNLTKNERIDIYGRYYFYIPIYMKPCPNGYIFIKDSLNNTKE